ncbi:hypothetical protein Tco_0690350 [Tanacetum coccineum]
MITTTKKPPSSSSSSASDVTMHDVMGSDVSSDEGLHRMVKGMSWRRNLTSAMMIWKTSCMTFPHMFHNADEANFLGSGVTKEVTVSSKDRRQKDKGVLSLLPSMELESDSTGIFFSVASARRRIE